MSAKLKKIDRQPPTKNQNFDQQTPDNIKMLIV